MTATCDTHQSFGCALCSHVPQESPVIENQPHALVVYTVKTDDEPDQWPQSITRFPTRGAAEAVRKMVANYSGAETDVFLLQEPANDPVTRQILAQHAPVPDNNGAPVNADEVSLGLPKPTGAHSHAVAALANAVIDLVTNFQRENPTTGTRDLAIGVSGFLQDAYKF